MRRSGLHGLSDPGGSTGKHSSGIEGKLGGMSEMEKVGRMKIREDNLIHVYVDGNGEIGTFLVSEMRAMVERAPAPEEAGWSVIRFVIDGEEYEIFTWQVKRMMENHFKKTAVFQGIEEN